MLVTSADVRGRFHFAISSITPLYWRAPARSLQKQKAKDFSFAFFDCTILVAYKAIINPRLMVSQLPPSKLIPV